MATDVDVEKAPASLTKEIPRSNTETEQAALNDEGVGSSGTKARNDSTKDAAHPLKDVYATKYPALDRLLSIQERRSGKDFSEHLHRLYRSNLTYHRVLLVKFAINLEEIREMSGPSDNGPAVFIREGIMKDLDESLRQYSRALKDYETFKRLTVDRDSVEDRNLGECAMELATVDEYVALGTAETAEKSNERENLVKDLRDKLFRWVLQIHIIGANVSQHVQDITLAHRMSRKQEEEFVKFTRRLTGGLLGGLALIVPMLIMDLHPTQLTSLLTTSVFVLALAILFAALTDWEPKDIIGATAAYAAVLVVFVGTSTSDSKLGNGRTGGLIAGVIGGLYLLTIGVAFVRAGPNVRNEYLTKVAKALVNKVTNRATRQAWQMDVREYRERAVPSSSPGVTGNLVEQDHIDSVDSECP